jgi:hypothetical protein
VQSKAGARKRAYLYAAIVNHFWKCLLKIYTLYYDENIEARSLQVMGQEELHE